MYRLLKSVPPHPPLHPPDVDDRLAAALGGQAACQKLVEHHSQGIHVAPAVDPARIARDLLRAHGPVHAKGRVFLDVRDRDAIPRVRGPGQKIAGDLRRPSGVKQHGGWLESTMHHVLFVQVRNRVTNAAKEMNAGGPSPTMCTPIPYTSTTPG